MSAARFTADQVESHRGLPRFFAVGDHVALDFLNTVAAPRKVRTEWIADGDALLVWLDAMKLISRKDALSHFAAGRFDEAAEAGRALREQIRLLVIDVGSNGIGDADLRHVTLLNKLLGADDRRAQLRIKAGRFDATRELRWKRPNEVLLPIADAITDLFCNGDFSLVRKCAYEPCSLWFYDRTKSHQRRWCTTAYCGNRAKVAAFRERNKG